MGLKELIVNREDILFAEIGALIHDLGKLSRRFILQACENNVDFFYDHSLIFARDFLNATDDIKYHKTDEELNEIITTINKKLESREFSEYKQVRDYIKSKIPEITSNNRANNFIALLKLKESKDELWKSKETSMNIEINIEIEGEKSSICIPDLISKHHGREKYYNPLSANIDKNIIDHLINSDHIDSAIDKMVAEKCKYIQQKKEHTYISTAFGHESQKIDLSLDDSNKKSLTKVRNDYADNLATILTDLKNLQNTPSDISKWIEKRDELFLETKKAFLNALGETRRPANDVTLWDHSFSVASLYKAALAEIIITNTNEWKEPKDIKWKFLSIRFDGDEFYYTVPKIADVLGRKNLVGRILDKIKNLLEVVIPIGNEIYRDENGSVFLVPMSAKEENGVFEINDEVWKKIKDIEFKNMAINFKGEWESKKLKDIANNLTNLNLKELIEKISSYMSEGIFIPEIHLSESSRGVLNLGDEIFPREKHSTSHTDSPSNISQGKRIIRKTIDIEKLKQEWSGKKEGYEKCTVCGLKPIPLSHEEKENLDKKIEEVGWQRLSEEEKNLYKAYERKICLDCLKLAQNRVEEWCRNIEWNKETPEKPSFDTSIWLDEIADENNRIALVYLSFDLEKWLNGEMLNTFLSKPIEILKESGLAFDDYESIVSYIKKKFEEKDENFWKVFDSHSKDKTGKEIFDDIIKGRDENWKKTYKTSGEDIDENDIKTKAKILLLNLTRKHPSFARLRRIWETTRNFGINIFEKIKNEKLEKRKRVVFELSNTEGLKFTHNYWFKYNSDKWREIAVVKDNKDNYKTKAVTVREIEDDEIELLKELKSKEIEIYNDINDEKPIAQVKIVNIMAKEYYYPIIPYQFEPSKTLFFMPLKQVWEVITLIKNEYEIKFNKVQNRLPINIGFVAFHKKTPMYAVLDAAKRMYSKKKKEPDKLKVCSVCEMDAQKNCKLYEGKIGNRVKEIKFENGYEYHFSYSTGEPGKEDLFHPYFIVENNNGWKTYVEKDWKTIKHVKYLQTGDKISFYPSLFDFLYLDTNTRRLDVGEKRIHWLFKGNSPKPYNLKDIEEFERLRKLLLTKLKLTTSQLLSTYGLLISKLQEWELLKENDSLPIKDKTFIDFVESTILSNPFRLKIDTSTQKGKITQDDFEFLKQTILNGIFFDFIDMWHTILKRKFKEDK